ncbi:uncharacterized protein LOC133850267 [Drosophila sulfurigaster albostrigata]|uniref:uncharacterized protein LOC133850267 n=1 Tax=Drosophila sulfurigaster albostrigata TaxID=89887 RepID=UPI002D21A1B8|nr:uncharacterized protein LOC133850267 [Drosophila sulfurigaster albostrigata]
MDFMDLDSFRQRYSDITVTAVPSVPKSSNSEENIDEVENNTVEAIQMAPPTPLVEIIPLGAATFVPSSSHQTRSKLQQQQKVADATAYANEYKQVLAKLEYTKFMQAQLQMMSLTTNGAGGGNATETPNIVDVYGSLLRTIAEMQSNLGPTTIGLRAPKERLLRDIAQARVLVRECILLLMRDQQQTVIVEEATQRQ